MVSLIQSFKPEKTAGVNFNPDGTLLATSTRDHSVTIWNVRSGQTDPAAAVRPHWLGFKCGLSGGRQVAGLRQCGQ